MEGVGLHTISIWYGGLTLGRWEPLEEKPEPGQWEYFGKSSTAS